MTPATLRAAAAVVTARADRGGLPHLHKIADALLEAADRLTPEQTHEEEMTV